MIPDPFAEAPADEAQLDPGAGAHDYSDGPPVSGIAVKPVIVPADDGKVVLTFKAGTTFDSPWIVVHATDLDDALSYVSEDGPKLMDLMARVKKAGAHFAGHTATAAAPAGQPAQQAAPEAAPFGATQPPSWAPPKPYDDFVYVTKVSAKNGKPWHAWMPPGKDDHRDPKFFYPPR